MRSRCAAPRAPLPDTDRLLQRPAPLRDCSQPGLLFADGAQRHQHLPLRRAGLPQTQIPPTKDRAAHIRPTASRAITSYPEPKSSHLWQEHFCVDIGTGSRGLLGAGSNRAAGEHRAYPSSPQEVRSRLAASQALDYLSRPRIRAQKKRRDTLIVGALRRAEQGWVVGYGDEVW